MSMTTSQQSDLLVQVLSLPARDRAAFARELLDSLPEDYDLAVPMDPEVRTEWVAEIRRRVAELDRGDAVTVDGEQVMLQLRAKYS